MMRSKRLYPMRLAGPLALALALGVAAPARAQRVENVTVRGQLLDRTNGHPLAAGKISIPARHVAVYTGAEGGFVLPAIPPGSYDVEIERLGYRSVRANMTLEKDDSVVVRLTPEPVALNELVVFGKRLLTRTERAPVSARSFDRSLLQTYSGGNTLDFLADNAGLRAMGCGPNALSQDCAVVRGMPEVVGVWIDGLPSTVGLEELRTIPPQEIFHINVYQGGALIEVITVDYARREAHHQVQHPLPPFSMMKSVQYQGQVRSMEHP